DFALLDRAGALIGNPFHYRDDRTDGMLEAAFQRMPREQIFERTGIQFLQINTLYQLLAMAIGGAPALEAAATFLTIPALFTSWLGGQSPWEFTNAPTPQCNAPPRGDGATAVRAARGFPQHIFPPIVAPGTALGALRPALAE